MSNTIIKVAATPTEVSTLLKKELTAADYDRIGISALEEDPFQSIPQRDIECLRTVVEFSANAVVGGALYDVVKRVYEILKKQYGSGAEKSESEDDKDDNPDDPSS